jgi:hypothetical protein
VTKIYVGRSPNSSEYILALLTWNFLVKKRTKNRYIAFAALDAERSRSFINPGRPFSL